MKDCLFCKIIRKEIPSKVVFENDQLFAIEDINPQAPMHLLILPKKHMATLLEIQEVDHNLMGSAFTVANQLAKQRKLDQAGFRVVINCGEGAGQSVFHIHFHLLGGRPMNWPPG
jgi:histidine triad (HIT) family protein